MLYLYLRGCISCVVVALDFVAADVVVGVVGAAVAADGADAADYIN